MRKEAYVTLPQQLIDDRRMQPQRHVVVVAAARVITVALAGELANDALLALPSMVDHRW